MSFDRDNKSNNNPSLDSSGSKTSSINVVEARRKMLELHNKARSEYNIPALKEDPICTTHAQNWADKLASEGKGISHSKDRNNMGENVADRFQSAGIALNAESVLKSFNQWFDEGQHYKYAKYPGGATKSGAVIGHYTQLMWEGSTMAGFGFGIDKTKTKLYVVGNYREAGNISGEYPWEQKS